MFGSRSQNGILTEIFWRAFLENKKELKMTVKNFKPEDYEERLPGFYHTIRLPPELWEAIKERSDQEKKALRLARKGGK